MKIAGIIKASLIEYPGKASTVIFFGGCNFRCGYCHNPELVFAEAPSISPEDFFAFLLKRKKFIDAVCISGGEPTLQPSLPDLIREIKKRGLSVKLETNGTNPSMLALLIDEGLVDYVAMDIKAPEKKYNIIAGGQVDFASVRRSAQLLIEKAKQKKIVYEFRTTVCKELLTKEDIRMMIGEYASPENWYLQTFKNSGHIIDQEGQYSAYTKEEMNQMGEEFCVNVR
ncbi:MAG: anaerobic ribonucleoside-triphosphate reductase activating protein [Eubacteriales bacterium]|nr:anaerobic ribonucleoside-triphosphate reductase activating protein [Eubacteriales bacterium]MDD3349841.1 anaerobic ribonucleoside-triphosphate reductase activating protein [Eubacteriales bacterium]